MQLARRKRGEDRRARNFLQPTSEQASDSVDRVIERAREVATEDHRDSFVSTKERDRIVDVYLQRARDRLREEHE